MWKFCECDLLMLVGDSREHLSQQSLFRFVSYCRLVVYVLLQHASAHRVCRSTSEWHQRYFRTNVRQDKHLGCRRLKDPRFAD